MDRSLDQKEKDKARAAHADFFRIHKRKKSTTKDQHPENESTSTNEKSGSMSPSKRFKFPGMTSKKPAKTPSKTPLIIRFYDADVQARDARGRTQEDILAWSDSELERCHNYIQMLFPVPEGSAFNWEAPIIDREVMNAFRARSELRDRLRLSFERMLDFYGFEVVGRKEEEPNMKKGGEVEEKAVEEVEGKVEGAAEAEDKSASSESKESVDSKSKASTGEIATEAQATITDAAEEDTTSTTSQPPYIILRAPHWPQSFRSWAVRFDHNHLRITRILRCLRILGLQTECDAFFEALKQVYNDPSVHISERTLSYWTRAVTRPLYIAPDDEQVGWLREWEEEMDEQLEQVEMLEKNRERME